MSSQLNIPRLFRSLRPRSALSLKHAIETADVDGAGGTLVIQIPPDAAKPCEVFFTTAPSQLVTDLWKQVS